ncbi:MAG TPA: SDR family NAD(P)-dependent oxidoreductase [Candidatus Sulfotelmatobacter sp.]|nr:SDR family NAD(P)-dependent oxidoreductase [Candidatus Sulfotelmatobacter sp.]
MGKPICMISGVGPGTGAALVRRFVAGGYQVAMLARTEGRLAALQAEVPGSRAYPCDVTDEARVNAVVAAVTRDMGAPRVLVHNAVGGAFGDFLAIDPAVLERNFRINAMGLLHLARAAAPAMIAAGDGAILVTGNTSALRGKANFAGFAPTKAAQRILAQSIARSLGPKGIHVAYVVVDAVIDVPLMRARMPDKPDEFFAKPAGIADTVWHLAHQDRSTWSFDVDLRPYGESW